MCFAFPLGQRVDLMSLLHRHLWRDTRLQEGPPRSLYVSDMNMSWSDLFLEWFSLLQSSTASVIFFSELWYSASRDLDCHMAFPSITTACAEAHDQRLATFPWAPFARRGTMQDCAWYFPFLAPFKDHFRCASHLSPTLLFKQAG